MGVRLDLKIRADLTEMSFKLLHYKQRECTETIALSRKFPLW